ncbi:hypothetical protein B0O99DRAFT_682047 [Bisporella sp. PMI_857]|nr:hypothetical protein B0O99DRAFT_682946 [Bisporella sp. PMI_857]KAH8600361.1 hypothetical protein B0O99DRAFT_682047 [Bisporella sp. PMI_857]
MDAIYGQSTQLLIENRRSASQLLSNSSDSGIGMQFTHVDSGRLEHWTCSRGYTGFQNTLELELALELIHERRWKYGLGRSAQQELWTSAPRLNRFERPLMRDKVTPLKPYNDVYRVHRCARGSASLLRSREKALALRCCGESVSSEFQEPCFYNVDGTEQVEQEPCFYNFVQLRNDEADDITVRLAKLCL